MEKLKTCVLSIVFLACAGAALLAVSGCQPSDTSSGLVVSSLSVPADHAVRGGDEILVTASIENNGKAAAAETRLLFYLSTDQVKDKDDILLPETLQVNAIAAGDGLSGAAKVTLPDSAAAGSYYLLACFDEGDGAAAQPIKDNCFASEKQLTLRRPTSRYLIDQAVAANTLDSETGLVYTVYTVFGDNRLPSQYQGDDEGSENQTMIMLKAAEQYNNLSAASQQLLAPFFIPPMYTTSWAEPEASRVSIMSLKNEITQCDLNSDWSSITTKNGKAKVWWNNKTSPGLQAKAQMAADALDADIWDKLTGLLWEPRSDNGSTIACGGGDDLLDVILVDGFAGSNTIGLTTSLPGKKGASLEFGMLATFIAIKADLPDKMFKATIAHEFMHALQFAYPIASSDDDVSWLMEATATWAEDFCYPGYQTEQRWFDGGRVGFPLKRGVGYDVYTWPFFLAGQGAANAQVIKEIWMNLSIMDSLAAINAAIPGGFEKQWPVYVTYCFNRDPLDEFTTWDGIPGGMAAVDEKPKDIGLGGKESRDWDYNWGADSLSAWLDWFSFTDDNIKKIEVQISEISSKQGASYQGLYKLKDGTWHGPEDWTNEKKKKFCRDKDEENVIELVLFRANSDYTSDGITRFDKGKVTVKKKGCKWPEHWKGTVTSTQVIDNGIFGTLIMTRKTSGEATFDLDSEDEVPVGNDKTVSRANYTLSAGNQVNWTFGGGSLGVCTLLCNPLNDKLNSTNGYLTLIEQEDDSIIVDGAAYMDSKDDEPGTVDCGPGTVPIDYPIPTNDCWFHTNGEFIQPPPENGKLEKLDGTATQAYPPNNNTYTWHFEAQD